MKFLEELAARRRFGMRPGLETMRRLMAALGNPERRLRGVIHIAGTNGKGAVAAILDAALREQGRRVGRYTSPHLVRLNERFFLDGAPVDDATLDLISKEVETSTVQPSTSTVQPSTSNLQPTETTFFEALTAVAFVLYSRADPDFLVLETGLGGRLDATNVCHPSLSVITRIGLDHCDWLGDTVEKIAAEKAGIIKPGVPVVLGRNEESVVRVVRARAEEISAPFFYAPDLAGEDEIPADFPLCGSFNRENAVTALAAMKVLSREGQGLRSREDSTVQPSTFNLQPLVPSTVTWPGRFQRVGRFLVDGAHNPPAARALAAALDEAGLRDLTLICGFCGDKDVEATLRILKPYVRRAIAVRTNNPRSLAPEDLAARLISLGIPAEPHPTLASAFSSIVQPSTSTVQPSTSNLQPQTLNLNPAFLVCGSLFLAGEALVGLGAYPWPVRFDPSERLVPENGIISS